MPQELESLKRKALPLYVSTISLERADRRKTKKQEVEEAQKLSLRAKSQLQYHRRNILDKL